jgi:hypothetical protein
VPEPEGAPLEAQPEANTPTLVVADILDPQPADEAKAAAEA